MGQNDGAAWADEELEASVDAYVYMQQCEKADSPYTKRAIYKSLAERYGRSEKAFEYRMQNISAVLDSMGLPWLSGLKPAANVGDKTESRLKKIIGGPPYRTKLPEMRRWLIQVAKKRDKTTYGDLMAAFAIDRFSLRAALSRLGHRAMDKGEPIITALVVNQATQRCSVGIETEFGVLDDEAERERVYSFWANAEVPVPTHDDSDDSSLAARAARFARAKVRPGQARFRRAVFLACGGRCVLSGCALDSALDAAHKQGREWQKGHNKASDGVLLRKDLHGLYDAGRIRIKRNGEVEIDQDVAEHYPHLLGFKCHSWT